MTPNMRSCIIHILAIFKGFWGTHGPLFPARLHNTCTYRSRLILIDALFTQLDGKSLLAEHPGTTSLSYVVNYILCMLRFFKEYFREAHIFHFHDFQ